MTTSHFTGRFQSRIVGCALFVLALLGTSFVPLLAQTAYEEGSQYSDKDAGVLISVPKNWKARSNAYDSLRGEKVHSVRVLQRHEDGSSRISAAVDVSVSSLYGLFGIPNRLRGKVTDADLVNFYIDESARTRNAYTVRTVRTETLGGVTAFVVESTEKTSDKYIAYSTEYLFFKNNRLYVIDAWYFAFHTDKKALLNSVVSAIRFIN